MIEQLQDMKARLEAATPGPWEVSGTHGTVAHIRNGIRYRVAAEVHNRAGDSTLIAHAPGDLAKLIAALEAVEELAAAAPRFQSFTGASVSGRVQADDILRLITEALA